MSLIRTDGTEFEILSMVRFRQFFTTMSAALIPNVVRHQQPFSFEIRALFPSGLEQRRSDTRVPAICRQLTTMPDEDDDICGTSCPYLDRGHKCELSEFLIGLIA